MFKPDLRDVFRAKTLKVISLLCIIIAPTLSHAASKVAKSVKIPTMDHQLESFSPFYVVGDAIPGGWNFSTAVLLEIDESGNQKATINLFPGKFRFFKVKNDWTSDLNYTYFKNLGYTIDSALEPAGDSDENFRFTGAPGKYVLEIMETTKKIILKKESDPTAMKKKNDSLSALWAVGDAVPGGWNFNEYTVKLTQESEHVWVGKLILAQDGSFRFFHDFGSWDTENNYAFYKKQGYKIDPQLTQSGSDKNFKFKGKTAVYTIKINGNNKTISLEQ